jgi:steroid delta-isomerase-like uncharacterized protein
MDEVAAVRTVFEDGWNREHFEPVEAVLSTNFEFHVGGTTQTMGVGDLREIVRRWRVGFPDLHFDIHSVVVSDGRAAAHATLRGTHRGPEGGVDPTGRSINVEHMFFFRFENRRIVEVWELLDRSELRRQLVED